MTTPKEWLAMTPWSSVIDLAGFSGVDRTTISRGMLPEWLESGLVAIRRDGRLVRPRDLLLQSAAGVADAFPYRHSHSGPTNIHYHDGLDLEANDHVHPTFFNSQAGAELLYSRLEFIEVAYPLARVALMGEGASWTCDGRPRELISWRWLRRTRLVSAVATYEQNFKLFFCWIGSSITAPMLRWRYSHLFDDYRRLITRSEAEEMERRQNKQIEAPDPDLDPNPQPSGWVIVGRDRRAIEIAKEVLPQHGHLRSQAYLYAIGPEGGRRLYVGHAEPCIDDVADRFEDIDIGIPEDLCH